MYSTYDYGDGTAAIIMVVVWLVIIGISVGLAFIPASIARKKGYSYGGFWAFGFFLFVPALIVALCIDNKNAAPQYRQYAPNNPGYSPYAQPQAQFKSFTCANCGKQIPAGSKFCTYCGAPAPVSSEKICPNCGYKNPENSSFCSNCGKQI